MRIKINGFVIVKAFKGYKVFRGHNLVGYAENYRAAFAIAGGV